MKHFVRLLTLLVAIAVAPACGAEAPALSNRDGKAWLRLKEGLAARAPESLQEEKRLRRKADALLAETPLDLVTGKKHLAPGGDPHDYVSIATYYWPNPDTADGLPYVVKDGVRNPAKEEYDGPLLTEMCQRLDTLGLAYSLTGEEKYAEAAARQLKAWFLDPATRMNPNLDHAQVRLGRDQGSASGLIDAVTLTLVTDSLQLLRGSRALTPDIEAGMKDWFSRYLKWMHESPNGRKEDAATNNHGVWYDAQAAAYAAYVGDLKTAKAVLESVKTVRIAKQIEPDGTMPREMARTLSFSYCVYNLRAFLQLCRLGEAHGVDLWNFRTKDGRSVRKAVDYLVPYATGEKPWVQKQIKAARDTDFIPILREGAVAWKEPAYAKAAEMIESQAGKTK